MMLYNNIAVSARVFLPLCNHRANGGVLSSRRPLRSLRALRLHLRGAGHRSFFLGSRRSTRPAYQPSACTTRNQTHTGTRKGVQAALCMHARGTATPTPRPKRQRSGSAPQREKAPACPAPAAELTSHQQNTTRAAGREKPNQKRHSRPDDDEPAAFNSRPFPFAPSPRPPPIVPRGTPAGQMARR